MLAIHPGPILKSRYIIKRLTTVGQVRIYGISWITVEVNNISTLNIQLMVMAMVTGKGVSIFVIKYPHQGGFSEVKFHDHSQKVATRPGEAD
jgi:hypothetical protein